MSFPADDTSLNESARSLTFLNTTRSFPDAIDWCPTDVNRLWRYNLHYFDYLRSKSASNEFKASLIDEWIAHNPQGSEPAWEPYTASLRITNWCKFFLQLPAEDIPQHWLNSLYEQSLWLSKNLERHILANHFFENLRALCFAGLTLTGDQPQKWLKLANRELQLQLKEQFLPDGGHYERSPQYHAIVLEGCLDILALTQAAPALFTSAITQLLTNTVTAGLSFLASIVDPVGDYPLFGDSAYGAAPTLANLNSYAAELGLEPSTPSNGPISASASGLFGYRNHQDWFLIDCGNIGPAYQPGHTHCDFLSFALCVDGEHLIVDSGVYEYEPGEMRTYVRSTAAHNTLSVNGTEQSQIWGEFRVAKRAKRLFAKLDANEQIIEFTGAYEGFFDIPKPIQHERTATLTLDTVTSRINKLQCTDQVRGGGEHHIERRLHLHPTVKAKTATEGDLLLTTQAGNEWRVKLRPALSA